MKTIGITGGIASGKSAVGRVLADYPLIDADVISREVVRPGQPGLLRVVEAFGQEMRDEQGLLDRTRLRALIAVDERARKRLNGILHPLIRRSIRTKLRAYQRQGAEVVFVSAALMIETGSFTGYDEVILVTAPFEDRLRRLMARDGMTEPLARSLMAGQWEDARKRPHAAVEIHNDGSLEDLETSTWAALQKLRIDPPATSRGRR